ncbi:hypothetical protein B6N60_01635 [Richelia sinica FACHB-800]|uniref:Uncharacterized protein n=1 Tax=Richelia sinica FACHB-800 TaxID=1357546 RepID=A0A975Y497_9NOST|nr:hypothetical protein B6N60_01635 [Richelia sinica FACHB-800]
MQQKIRDELRLLAKGTPRFFATLRLCAKQKSSHSSATPKIFMLLQFFIFNWYEA